MRRESDAGVWSGKGEVKKKNRNILYKLYY